MLTMITSAFAKSMTSCVEILLGTDITRIQFMPRDYILVDLNWRIQTYLKLKELMEYFNVIAKWQIFVQMTGVIAHICLFIYIPLRHWETIGTSTSITFIVHAILAVLGIMMKMYPLMGTVYEKSSQFRHTFKELLAKALPFLIIEGSGTRQEKEFSEASRMANFHADLEFQMKVKSLELMAETCIPFGFRGAIFFTFKMTTLLTAFYAVITHIIIMLQLDL